MKNVEQKKGRRGTPSHITDVRDGNGMLDGGTSYHRRKQGGEKLGITMPPQSVSQRKVLLDKGSCSSTSPPLPCITALQC